jgi:PPOX class probable FMN-dependent enzyme
MEVLGADSHIVLDEAALLKLYDVPREASLLKEADHLTPEYQAMVAASPFLVMGTAGPKGLDCTPRGDAPGFVAVEGPNTLLLPDRRGNNRLDSLRNILTDPRVALIFLIPGIGETLRVNGRAVISTDPALRNRFVVEGKAPAVVLVITVETVFFQCAKAIMRSHLWDPASKVERSAVPSAGAILAERTRSRISAAEYDDAAPQRLKETLY